MIVMDSKAQLTVDVIAKVNEGKVSIKNAAKLLSKSTRTVERYLQKYRTEGIQFVVHKNTNRVPVNKHPTSLKKQVQSLIKKKYFDYNLTHLNEMLEQKENIRVKRETLRRWAHEIHHVKRAQKRRPKARKRRERMASPGLMLQMDGSTHCWFGHAKSCLIAIIDDANSEIHGEFFKSETTVGCLKVIKDYIAKKGVFKTLYVDRAGIFAGPKRSNFSQVQRACNELGIEIIYANSPQGKGRIERAFNTLQDRLIPELRTHKIDNLTAANRYLQDQFIPNYWNKVLVVEPRYNCSGFTAIPHDSRLDEIFSQKEYRKIRNEHTFSYGNTFYLIKSKLRTSIAKQKIEIRTELNGSFNAYFAGVKLDIAEVIEPNKPSMVDLEIQKKLAVLALAEKLNNVSEAARISGVSRDTIYRHRKIVKEKGTEGLKRQVQADHYHKNRADKNLEETVITFSLENPHLGQAQVARQMKIIFNIDISSGGVRNIWLREEMQTIALRLQRANSMASAA